MINWLVKVVQGLWNRALVGIIGRSNNWMAYATAYVGTFHDVEIFFAMSIIYGKINKNLAFL